MKRQGIFRHRPGFVLGVVVTLALVATVAGCSSGQSTLARVLHVLSNEEAPLSPEALKQLKSGVKGKAF